MRVACRCPQVLAVLALVGATCSAGSATIGPSRTAGVAAPRGKPVRDRFASVTLPSTVLKSVSCSSAGECFAVGTRQTKTGNRGLIQKWDGKAWSVVPSPSQATSPYGPVSGTELFGVSCSSADACVAVGSYQIPHGTHPFAEVWNGTAWRLTRASAPASPNSGLNGVSCQSADQCVAVGYAIRGSTNNAFSAAWDGQSFASIAEIDLPAGTTYSNLSNVSCTATICMAAGTYQVNGSSASRTLIEKCLPAGCVRGWIRLVSPSPASGPNGSHLSGVSCASTVRCVAVGAHVDVSGTRSLTLTETWNGTGWRQVLGAGQPGAFRTSVLAAVSCPSTTACVAVGAGAGAGSAAVSSPLAARLSGGRWTATPTPGPLGSAGLESVSCLSVKACVAVGDYVKNPGPSEQSFALAEVWNGRQWTIEPTP